MWVVAGVLLGIVVLASLVGFHFGPHSHAIAGGVGILAGVWLLVMAFTGNSAPLLWSLFSADLVVSAGVGITAWKALTTPTTTSSTIGRLYHTPTGADGIATTDLNLEGVVRVRGETWSATSLNGPIQAGTHVQVVSREGVRLQVWGDESEMDTTSTSGDVDHSQPLPS